MPYHYVDADSHVNEPPNLWQDRVAAKLKKRAPRVVPWHNGGDASQFAAVVFAVVRGCHGQTHRSLESREIGRKARRERRLHPRNQECSISAQWAHSLPRFPKDK